MASKSAFNCRSHAQSIDRRESSKVFEIEQCMYNLSEDFLRQTTLREPVVPVVNDAGPVAPEVLRTDEPIDGAPIAHSVHQLEDILRRPISDEILRKLCFSEMLLVCDGNETIVGGAAINVSLIADEVLAAFSSTRLTFLGHSTAESELMSFADRNCRPLQERKCETLLSGATGRQEKQIQLYFDEAYNVTAYRQESNGLHTESFHGLLTGPGGNGEDGTDATQTILPDGLQLLLLRYLVLSNFVGEICSQTIDVQGRVGNCIHNISAAFPVPKAQHQKASEAVKEVRKTTWYSDGAEPEESVSHYDSSTGRLVRHGWNSSNYILIANPFGTSLPTGLVDLERSMQDYVRALSGVIKNRSSVKGLLDDMHYSVKEMDQCKNVETSVDNPFHKPRESAGADIHAYQQELQTSPVGLPASDPPPYLPQRVGNSDGYPLAKPMGPIGPWATGRVDWGALSGQTGTRPVVNQYSITRYSVDEWRQRNANMINACDTTVEQSVQVENASKNTIIRTYAIADKTQTDCTHSLHVRAKNIDNLKCELNRAIASMQEEIAALERQRRRLKQSLAVLRMPEAIANECLERRTGRPDTELIRDRPEEELIQEISLISEIKALLLQTLANIEQQQSDNRAVRQRMEFDWSEKKVAHENDAINCNLRNQSTNTLFKPGATRCCNEQSTEIYWEKFTRETLDMYQNCRHKSEQLRNTLDAILTNAARDLRTQADSVERALATRISCMEEIREKLEIDLRTILQRLADTEIQIDKLKVAIRNMDYSMMVVQTRLDNRNQRPRVENCRDQPQNLLIAEVKSLEVGTSAMNAQLKQEEDVKQELINRRNELEREIMLKRRTIAIDRDRCQLLRSHFPSSTALSGY
uniref:Tektin n=1 Tax=Anopheles minimus TaxID=112268 RepID=A0A182W8M4_9DIPT